jgi:ppGpp synthetase/RelA/SpoT-type nucleotidyltranferase
MAGRNDALEELKVKLDILIKNYNNLQKYKEAAEILKKENEQLKTRYEALKNASSFTSNTQNVKETKLYVSRLIREIDKCIALLSA